MDFYHDRMVVYRHCQQTFQCNQLVKVHVPLYDPFKEIVNIVQVTPVAQS